jgi:hypothetical protein
VGAASSLQVSTTKKKLHALTQARPLAASAMKNNTVAACRAFRMQYLRKQRREKFSPHPKILPSPQKRKGVPRNSLAHRLIS